MTTKTANHNGSSKRTHMRVNLPAFSSLLGYVHDSIPIRPSCLNKFGMQIQFAKKRTSSFDGVTGSDLRAFALS